MLKLAYTINHNEETELAEIVELVVIETKTSYRIFINPNVEIDHYILGVFQRNNFELSKIQNEEETILVFTKEAAKLWIDEQNQDS